MQYLKLYGEQLIALGYRIVPLPPGSKGPRRPGWQKLQATPELVRQWTGNGSADDGVGILAATTPAVDVDIPDPAIAQRMQHALEDILGAIPHLRIGKAPKFLVPFRCDAPFRKMSSAVYYDALTDTEHRVEILADGQQWVAYHEHPDTHQPYTWPVGGLLATPQDQLPLLTPDLAARIVQAFEDIAGELVDTGQWEVKQRAAVDKPPAPVHDPLLDYKPQIDFETLKAALRKIPNAGPDELTYEQWRDVIFAIHRETNGQDHGLQLAHAWSKRSGKYDPTFLDERVWPYIRADRAGGVTGRTILAMAKKYDADPLSAPRESVGGARFKPGELFMQGFESVAYRVDGLLPDVGVAMAYGMSGTAKTFAMLALAFAVHRGDDWLGHRTTAAPVFYIASEASRGIRKRIAAYIKKFPGTIPYFADRAPDLMNLAELEEIAEEIEAAGGGGMLIIDTLATSHSGDENSAQDMGRVIQNATYLSLRLGCLVVLVHHSRKDGLDFRGSYTLRANVDAVAEITAEGERPNRVHRITFHKTRDDDDGQQIGFKLVKSEPLGYTATGRVIDSCTIEETPLAKKAPEKKKKPNDDMSLMLEVYEEISCLGACTTVIEILEAARVKVPSKKEYNLRRSLAAWVGYEGKRLPDDMVVVL